MMHQLKTSWLQYQLIVQNLKTAEFRKNDRNFQVGDTIILREWSPINGGIYTGQELSVFITCITEGFGIPKGYVMLSFRRT